MNIELCLEMHGYRIIDAEGVQTCEEVLAVMEADGGLDGVRFHPALDDHVAAEGDDGFLVLACGLFDLLNVEGALVRVGGAPLPPGASGSTLPTCALARSPVECRPLGPGRGGARLTAVVLHADARRELQKKAALSNDAGLVFANGELFNAQREPPA